MGTPTIANRNQFLVIPSLIAKKTKTRSTRRTKLKFPPNRTRRSGPEFCVECGVGFLSNLKTNSIANKQKQETPKPTSQQIQTINNENNEKNKSPSTRSTRRKKLKFPPNRIRRSGSEFYVECGMGYATQKSVKTANRNRQQITTTSSVYIPIELKDLLREQDVSMTDIQNKFNPTLCFDDERIDEAIQSLDENEMNHPKIIRDLMHEMAALKDEDSHSVFNEYMQQIIEFFQAQIIDYDVLKALNKKDFVNQISSHCSDNGMRCKLSSIYDAMRKYYDVNIEYDDNDIDEILEELDAMDSKEHSLDLWIRSVWIVGSLIEFCSNDADIWIVGCIERISDDGMLKIKAVENRTSEAQSKDVNRNDDKTVRPLSKALPVYQYVYDIVHK